MWHTFVSSTTLSYSVRLPFISESHAISRVFVGGRHWGLPKAEAVFWGRGGGAQVLGPSKCHAIFRLCVCWRQTLGAA